MARLGPNPIFRAYDTSGNLLRGGKVYTYVTGTSTAKATFADRDLTIKNSNPIILDSLGEATVYLKTDTDYRFVVKDKDDVTLTTVDGVAPATEAGKLTGDIDVGDSDIVSSSGGDITVTPGSSGNILLDGIKWPQADGSNGFTVATDGTGNLRWVSNSPRWSYDKIGRAHV